MSKNFPKLKWQGLKRCESSQFKVVAGKFECQKLLIYLLVKNIKLQKVLSVLRNCRTWFWFIFCSQFIMKFYNMWRKCLYKSTCSKVYIASIEHLTPYLISTELLHASFPIHNTNMKDSEMSWSHTLLFLPVKSRLLTGSINTPTSLLIRW